MNITHPILIALLIVCPAIPTFAQDDAPKDVPKDAPKDAPQAPSNDAKADADPTQPSDTLRNALSPVHAPGPGGKPAIPQLPTIRLRARIMVKDKPAVAVVQVDQLLYHISLGAQLAVPSTNGAGLVDLVVEQLDAQAVKLTAPVLKQFVLLR